MATSKLTLSVDTDIIAKAKKYAAAHQVSISKLFSDFISKTAGKEEVEEDEFLKKVKAIKVSPEIEKITGILKGKVPDDFDYDQAKYEYFKEKYGL
ncbi:DUF6364 family protein [Mucilaginibacter sp.]